MAATPLLSQGHTTIELSLPADKVPSSEIMTALLQKIQMKFDSSNGPHTDVYLAVKTVPFSMCCQAVGHIPVKGPHPPKIPEVHPVMMARVYYNTRDGWSQIYDTINSCICEWKKEHASLSEFYVCVLQEKAEQ